MNDPTEESTAKRRDIYEDYPAAPRVTVEAVEHQGRRWAFFLTCSMIYYTYSFASSVLRLNLSRAPKIVFIILGIYVAVGLYFLYRLWRLPRPALWIIMLPWVLQLAIALRYQSAHSSSWLIPIVSAIATVILWRNWKRAEQMRTKGVPTDISPVQRVS